MISICLNEQQLEGICDILGDTEKGYTNSELMQLLKQSNISLIPNWSNYSKRVALYNCCVQEVNNRKCFDRIIIFLEKSLNPVAFTKEIEREKYEFLLNGVNRVLLLAGFEMTKNGKLQETTKAQTLDEVDRRVNSLSRKLYERAIHDEVKKYCIKDYLQRDYYDAVFESAKGLAERVRNITGSTLDGVKLFEEAFNKSDPCLFFNSMTTSSEISEFIGLKELLQAIFRLVRNPAAHTPKINWKIDETKALDVLTVISFAHKYLDECHKMPK